MQRCLHLTKLIKIEWRNYISWLLDDPTPPATRFPKRSIQPSPNDNHYDMPTLYKAMDLGA